MFIGKKSQEQDLKAAAVKHPEHEGGFKPIC